MCMTRACNKINDKVELWIMLIIHETERTFIEEEIQWQR